MAKNQTKTQAKKKKWTFIQLTDEQKCEAIDKYYNRKVKELNKAESILQETRETTASSNSDLAPAITIVKTNKQFLKDSLPSLVDFAVEIGFSTVSINKWYQEGKQDDANDQKKYFSEKVMSLRELSQKAIIDARNNGYIDPVFSKFLLSAWYGYSDKVETENTNTVVFKTDTAFDE